MKTILLFFFTILMSACGGGTSGSSSTGGYVERSLRISLKDEGLAPLAFAKVSVIASGEELTTDENGSLQANLPLPTGINHFAVTASDGREYVIEGVVSDSSPSVTSIQLLTRDVRIQYGGWLLTATVRGKECRSSFTSRTIVSQTATEAQERQEALERDVGVFGFIDGGYSEILPIERGSTCIVEVSVSKDGTPVKGLAYRGVTFLCGNEQSPGTDRVQFAEGTSTNDGKMTVHFTIPKDEVCNTEIQIPEWGDLPLGAIVGIRVNNPDAP